MTDAFVLYQQKSSFPHGYPSCWATSQRSHTLSSMLCHGGWTSAPLSAHLSIKWECTASQIEPLTCTHRTPTHQFIRQQQQKCGAQVEHQWNAESLDNNTRLRTSSLTSAPTFVECPCQEQREYGLTAWALVLDVSAPAYTNGVWPLLLLVSVAQKNKWSTMLSSNVKSSNLPMDWMVRDSNGCSTPAPTSTATRQWIERTGTNDEEEWWLLLELDRG